jgi:hypothetical protein
MRRAPASATIATDATVQPGFETCSAPNARLVVTTAPDVPIRSRMTVRR